MKQKLENVVRNKKVMIALMEILIAIGCIVIIYLLMTPKDRVKETTYSYSKVEEVTEYRVVDNYITRVMPLTSYEIFKETAENTLNAASEDVQYTVKVYSDAEKTEEITSGYIASGMVVEAIEKLEETHQEETENQETKQENGELPATDGSTEGNEIESIVETEPTEEIPEEESTGKIYTISVLGDMTKDGDISIAELTKLIKGVVGLTEWSFTEEEKLAADISGDNEINVVDIELCINYIVFGKLDFEEATFTVIFKDYDGRVISSKKDYHYGDTIEIPEEPTREADGIYKYEFAGWAPVISEKVTKDEVYVATYKTIEIATEAGYKVEHYKETQEGAYELAEIEELVEKIGEEVTATAKEYTGYSENVENEDRIVAGTVLEDGSLVLKLYYDRNTYTVTFKDEDGTEVSTKTYKYEDTVELPENPGKPEDETYTYEFAGWTPEVSETVTGNAEYTATYTSIYKEYTVIFKQDNGMIINSTVYHYGDTVELPENPTKESTIEYAYKFTGWTPEVEEIVTDNAEYTAIFEEEEIMYNIIFYNDDGVTEVGKIEDYTWGDSFVFPTSPTKEPTEEISYVFYAWENLGLEEISATEKRVKLVAQYREEYFVARIESTDTLEGASYFSLEEAIEKAGGEARTIRMLRDSEESLIIEDEQNITINLNGKTVTGTGKYTIRNYGTLLVIDNSTEKGGTIGNTNNTVVINDGNLILGYDDGAIEENIIIKGQECVIENNNNFYMYDGTLIGKTTVTGNDVIIPEGEKYGLSVREENGMQIATIQIVEIPVAQVEDKYYASVQQAIDENNGKTVKLVKDEVTVTETIKVLANTEIVLDLNGKILESIGNGYVIENSGVLKITDSTADKTGEIINNNGNGVKNTRDLTVENIAITTQINTYDVDVYAIYNEGGTFSVNNTSITAEAISKSSSSYGIYNENATGNIDNSNISAFQNQNFSSYGIYNSKSNVKIQNSNIYSKMKNRSSNTAYGIRNLDSGSELSLNNVMIEVEGKTSEAYAIRNEGNNIIEIEGGKISCDDMGIYNSAGTLTINVELLNANSYAIYNRDSTYNVGKVEVYGGVIESTNSCGILNPVGIFNFLGGIIKGKTEAISGSINEITNGKSISMYEEDGVKIAELVDRVQINRVEVGDTQYETLENALLANKENTEEIYMKIIENTEEINIQVEENQNITIDLNGKELVLYEEIINKGTLKIIDSSEGKNGHILSKASKIIDNNTEEAVLDITGITADLKSNSINGYGLYNSAGTINVKDSTINVEIVSGEAYTYVYGIYNSKGTINIKKSNISAVMESSTYNTFAYGIRSSGGNINLGEKDDISSEDLIIIAQGGTDKNIGIYTYNATLNFYDGIIKSENTVISGKITELETGYEQYEYIDETDNLNAIKLIEKLPEAKVGDVEYLSIQDAVDESVDNEETTVEILRDIKLTLSELTIGESKNIILDLKGYTLTATTENTIKNLGILNVTDSSNEATGVIENTSEKVIHNEGELKVTQGKINTNVNTLNASSYGIYNNGEGNAEISGGIITASGSSHYYGIYNYSSNNIVINGGTIELKGKYTMRGICNCKTGNVIINTGDIIIERTSDSSPSYGISNEAAGNIEINGGNISISCKYTSTFREAKSYGIYNNTTGSITIKGGNITANITGNYKCYSYAIYNQSEGIINIEDGEIVGIAGKTINNVYYPQTGYGIYNQLGTLNYYGGTIKGTTESIYGEVSEISEGKKILITQEETIEVATLEEDTPEEIFKVGENTYADLKTAIAACQEGNNTIEITKDVTLTNSVNIGEIVVDKDIILDLKGFSIKLYNQITNKSNLTIKDSSTGKAGTLESKTKYTINNEFGNLTISNITISGGIYGIYNNGGNIKVEEASITAETYGVYNIGHMKEAINVELIGANITSSLYGIYNINNYSNLINVIIDEGTVISSSSSEDVSSIYAICNSTKSSGKIKVIIDGNSRISATNSGQASYSYGIYNYIYNTGEISVELISGTINSNSRNSLGNAYGIRTLQSYYINNYSNVKIVGGTINANGDADARGIAGADVEMSGGTISVNSDRNVFGIDTTNENSNIVITGGVVDASSSQSTGYGVYATKGKVTIGSMDGEINKSVPDISGPRIGVYIGATAQLNFYDGIIKGSTPIEGTVTDIEPGYKIDVSTVDSVNVATLTKISTAEAIAQVGNLYFNDLQQAIDACQAGGETIKILVDINLNETLNVEEGQNITIDLNGCIVKSKTVDNVILNKGTLTIIDSVGGGSIGTIDNQGTLSGI